VSGVHEKFGQVQLPLFIALYTIQIVLK